MDISETQNSSHYIMRNGAIGLVCGLVLVVPVTDWSLDYWLKIYPAWSNIDDLMGMYCFGPLTAMVGGIVGGYLGLKIGQSAMAEIVGSITGGILIGVLIPIFLTFTTVQAWTPK